MSWTHKLVTGYIALMVVGTIGQYAVLLALAYLEPVEALQPFLGSDSFGKGAYVAIWVLSALVAGVYMTAVYVVDDAGIRKWQLVGGWFVARDDIAEATVETGTFNSHLKLVLRDRRTKVFIMTPSMVLALQTERGTHEE